MPPVWCSTKMIGKLDVTSDVFYWWCFSGSFHVFVHFCWCRIWIWIQWPNIATWQSKNIPVERLGKLNRASGNVREGHFPFNLSRIKSNFHNLQYTCLIRGTNHNYTTTRRISRFLLRVGKILLWSDYTWGWRKKNLHETNSNLFGLQDGKKKPQLSLFEDAWYRNDSHVGSPSHVLETVDSFQL